jgi:FkbM family methyltransferase
MNVKRSIKNVINAAIEPLGFRLEPKPPANRFLTKRASLEVLKELGLQPKTVIDVGVRHGTPELYETFPKSKHVLVEPVREFESLLKKSCRLPKDVEFVRAAASNWSGKSPLAVSAGYESARLGEAMAPRWDLSLTREVDVVTLDQACEERHVTGPYLIKVDVDGKDIEVLEGASRILKDTDCIIVEAPPSRFRERIEFLEDRFFLWDVVDLIYNEQVFWQADLVMLHRRLDTPQYVSRRRQRAYASNPYVPTFD